MRQLRKRLLRAAAAVAGLGFAGMVTVAPSAAAPVTYQYTGNNYDTVSGVYTTAMSVFGSFTVGAPLAPSMGFTSITADILAFNFFDGLHTITEATTTSFGINISTDGLGNIDTWRVDLQKFNRDNPSLMFNIGIVTASGSEGDLGNIGSTGSKPA
jgi:hypothetical protein